MSLSLRNTIQALDTAQTRIDDALADLRDHDCEENCSLDHEVKCNCEDPEPPLTYAYDTLEKTHYTDDVKEIRCLIERTMTHLVDYGAKQ